MDRGLGNRGRHVRNAIRGLKVHSDKAMGIKGKSTEFKGHELGLVSLEFRPLNFVLREFRFLMPGRVYNFRVAGIVGH